MKRVSMLPPSNSGITACVLVFMFQNVRSPEELIFQLLQPDGFTIAAKNIEGHDLLNAAQTFLQGQSIPKLYGIMHMGQYGNILLPQMRIEFVLSVIAKQKQGKVLKAFVKFF